MTLIQPISGLRRNSHAIVWMMPGTMSGTSAIPYQRLRSGTSVRSTAQATAVPTTNATSAAPAAYTTELKSSSTEVSSVSTRSTHCVVKRKSRMLPPRETAPRRSIASGTTVRYASTATATPTRTRSARSEGARSATRRAVTPAEVISADYLMPRVVRQKAASLSKSARIAIEM